MVDLTTAQISSALLYSSNYWGGSTVTFSFPGAGANWNGYSSDQEPFREAYSGLSAAQQDALRGGLGVWDRLISLSLVETSDPGQIRIAFTDVKATTGENSWGFAFAPSGSAKGGDIWIEGADHDGRTSHKNSAFTPGAYDYMAAMHEMGHALGLKHPFGDGQTLPGQYDNYRYSIMSYTPNTDYQLVTFTSDASNIYGNKAGVYPTTPMLFDVAAIQARYGADQSTATNDTTYSFEQSRPIFQTIYDAGGIDTLDLSAHSRASIVDLTPGAFSSIAKFTVSEQASYWKSQIGGANSYIDSVFNDRTYTWTDNLATAFNTTIENVRGGSAADRVQGNDANNNLRGGGGNDSLNGVNGDDYIRGDDGDDLLTGGAGFDDINGNKGADTVYGGQGNDWVVGGQDADLIFGDLGNDLVYGNIGNDTLYGGDGADILRGGQNDDVLYGEAGDDWLWGDRGNDILTGGAGADRFHIFTGSGVDRVTDFSSASGDRVRIDGGAPYTVSFVGGDATINIGNGDMLILNGVSSADILGNWLI